MTLRRVLILLAVALAAILGSMYLSSQRHLDRDPQGGTLLPGLEAGLDAVTGIEFRKGSEKPLTVLHRTAPGAWVVSQRADYPADAAKVRRLLFALADAKITEQKTSNPASYPILGVEDASAAHAGGTQVSLVAPGRTTAVIVGHSTGNGNYVRRAGEATSFAVEPAIQVDAEPRDWIDGKLLDVPAEKIQDIRMRLADHTAYRISRLPTVAKPGASAGPSAAHKPGAPDAGSATPAQNEGFKLDSVPAGREAASPDVIAPSPTSYNGVTADDVSMASDIDFGKPSVAEITLTDGSVLTLTGTVAGDRHWITLHSSKDETLNARTRGRAFEIASYRYDSLFRPLEQLLKPRPAKPEKSAKAVTSSPKPAHAHP